MLRCQSYRRDLSNLLSCAWDGSFW